jgi:ABC-2 type transport system ATP-binding protein
LASTGEVCPERAGGFVDAVIELDGLVKVFRGHLGIGRFTAVDGLSLNVRRGEIFGLLGPNGAGKTTTLKTMLGLLRPDRGTVRLLGLPPSDPAARARIGFLPENPYFYDHLTGEELLDFYGRLQGIAGAERKRRVDATIARVGLAGRAGGALRKFSKGMVQRLGLAQAILHDPDLVILDEPMSGLDPVGRREVRDLILGLREAGKTVFFSSHILQDAEMICDRVAIVVDGRLRHLGSVHDLVSAKPRWFEVAVDGAVPGAWASEIVSNQGAHTLVRVPDVDALTRLVADVAGAGGQVVSVWPRRDTLEDLFLREVGTDEARA